MQNDILQKNLLSQKSVESVACDEQKAAAPLQTRSALAGATRRATDITLGTTITLCLALCISFRWKIDARIQLAFIYET